jgi:hypothetical protein
MKINNIVGRMVILLSLVLLVAGVFIPDVFSDEETDEEKKADIKLEGSPKDKLAMLKAWKLIDYLDLEYDQAMEFFSLYNEVEESRKDFMNKKKALVEDLKDELKKTQPSDEIINQKIDELFIEENNMVRDHQTQYDNMNQVLDTEQMAKMIIFEEKFQDELLRIIKDMQKDHEKPTKKSPYWEQPSEDEE